MLVLLLNLYIVYLIEMVIDVIMIHGLYLIVLILVKLVVNMKMYLMVVFVMGY